MERRMKRALRERLPTLLSARADEAALRKAYYRSKGGIAVEALKKNRFRAVYADTKEEAAGQVFQLIPPGATVGCGDSHTVFALHVEERLKREKNCDLISHQCALNTDAVEHPAAADMVIGSREEMRELLMRYLTSDVFLLGANAITLDGQIVNVDGRGNRVVGGIYGPDRIIVVAGVNKIVRDLAAARERVGSVAAPINNLKYENEMPCVKGGRCVDCRNPQRICNVTTVIHRCPENADYHVILIGEELGF